MPLVHDDNGVRRDPKALGGYASSQSNEWDFNNIVMFGSPELEGTPR